MTLRVGKDWRGEEERERERWELAVGANHSIDRSGLGDTINKIEDKDLFFLFFSLEAPSF